MKTVLGFLLFCMFLGACSQSPMSQGKEKYSDVQISAKNCNDLVTNVKQMSGLSEQIIAKKIVFLSQSDSLLTSNLAIACLDQNLTISCTQGACTINERK